MNSGLKKEAVKQFMNFTSTSETTAIKYLKLENYDVQSAVNAYFQTHNKTQVDFNHAEGKSEEEKKADLSLIFDQYKDANEGIINIEGVEAFCKDIDLEPTEPSFIVLCYYLDATTMGEFTQKQFVDGWTKLNMFKVSEMQTAQIRFNRELGEMQMFKPIYRYAFKLFLNSGARTLTNETACELWSVLLKDKFPKLDLWLDFCANHHKAAINKDVWNLMLSFSSAVSEDFSNYSADDAWPVIFDNYVEFAKSKLELA